MTSYTNQMYFKVSDSKAVEEIDQALSPADAFRERLYALEKQYGANTSHIFNSIDRGISFACLWFKELPDHLNTKDEFKVSHTRNMEGFELRPRKSNKKFYSEFYENLQDVSYDPLLLALFGTTKIRPEIEFSKRDNEYFISTNINLVLPHQELTATQYNISTK